MQGNRSTAVFRQGYTSSKNPFVPPGWLGSCTFPQITAGGLDDSWQHGADLYAVYHELLRFLPSRQEARQSTITYRVTNNVITHQVAGMVVGGMWSAPDSWPLFVQVSSPLPLYLRAYFTRRLSLASWQG